MAKIDVVQRTDDLMGLVERLTRVAKAMGNSIEALEDHLGVMDARLEAVEARLDAADNYALEQNERNA